MSDVRHPAFGFVVRWASFAILLFVLVTWLWIDVTTDCLINTRDYAGCPRHLPAPLRVFFPYGFVIVVLLGALAARSRLATAVLMAGILVVVLSVLGGLEWWLTGDFLLGYL
ncbi:MAG: hypothetical protein GY720_23550 [bacterium]|nr:hypothetical protein [bacterium]